MVQKYKRPPIVEAVIDVRVRSPINADAIEKIKKRLVDLYPSPPQHLVNINFEFSEASNTISQQLQGFRLTSVDAADIVTLTPQSVSTSRLAPYQDWESLVGQAERNWDTWKRVAGWREIQRVGVRYINRIDIPNPNETPIAVEDYLTFSPRVPAEAGAILSFAINASSNLREGGLKLILNAGTSPSVLVKTHSLIIDLDLSQDSSLPQNDRELWDFINTIRVT